jgi:hypothetical protein
MIFLLFLFSVDFLILLSANYVEIPKTHQRPIKKMKGEDDAGIPAARQTFDTVP